MVYIDLLVDLEFIEEYSKALYIPGEKEFLYVLTSQTQSHQLITIWCGEWRPRTDLLVKVILNFSQ
jgi:hypothetical protein